jgi:hypothetical protein
MKLRNENHYTEFLMVPIERSEVKPRRRAALVEKLAIF